MGGKGSKDKEFKRIEREFSQKLSELEKRISERAEEQNEQQQTEMDRIKADLHEAKKKAQENENAFSEGIDRLALKIDDFRAVKTGTFNAKPNTNNHVGLCIILTNNANDSDVDRLADAFNRFQFEVKVFANMTSAQLMETLSTAVRPELEYSCVAVAVVWNASNRNNARLGENVIKTIWSPFVLHGNAWDDKPKLFFLQIDELSRQDDLKRQYPSPANLDILIVHNTPGASERFPAILTKELKSNARQEITKTMERLKAKGKIKYISTLQKQFCFSNCA